MIASGQLPASIVIDPQSFEEALEVQPCARAATNGSVVQLEAVDGDDASAPSYRGLPRSKKQGSHSDCPNRHDAGESYA